MKFITYISRATGLFHSKLLREQAASSTPRWLGEMERWDLWQASGDKSKVRCVVRSMLAAMKVSGIEFRRLAAQHSALNALCIDYNNSLLSKTQLLALRYALLSVDARLAACLLDVSSFLSGDSIPLTQEVIGEMLAVTRPSVTDAGCRLKAAGIISYSRGEIQILDRAGLLKLSRAIPK
jgi:hypothetical protein